MIEFRCCKCKAVFKVGDEQVGQEATCQWCGHVQVVPDPDVTVEPGTIPFRCSNCGVLLVVGEELADRQVRCGECDQVVVVTKSVGDLAQRIPDPPEPPPPATKPLPAEESDQKPQAPAQQGPGPSEEKPPPTKPLPAEETDQEPEPPPAADQDPPDTKPLFTMVGNLMEFPCRKCGHIFRVSPELAGKKGKCQKCGTVNIVPGGR